MADSTDLAAKLVTAALSTAGSITQMATTIRTRSKTVKWAEAKVERLDFSYVLVIKVPIWISSAFLFAVLVLCFITLIGGVLILSQRPLPRLVGAVYNNWYWVFLFSVVAFVLVYFDWISYGLLRIAKVLDDLRYKPGWNNADWQLRGYRESFAMNINDTQCQNLAAVIYEQIIDKKEVKQSYQAPDPQGLDADEKANYLLFKCATEARIHQSGRKDLGINAVTDSQNYLAWAAQTGARPFKPDKLREVLSGGNSFYARLRDLPSQFGAAQGSLPDHLPIETSVQNTLKTLLKEFNGQGSHLAERNFTISPKVLLQNLEKFESLGGPAQDSMRRLYLKLSIRMNVWPPLRENLGPFLYPQNAGIAILLLNSGCLVLPSDEKIIDITDDNFWALVAEAEDRIANQCHQWLLEKGLNPEAEEVAFSTAVFSCDPKKVDKWRFTDYIDVWLYGHTSHCRKQKPKGSDGEPAAPIATEGTPPEPALLCGIAASAPGCYCLSQNKLWYQEGISIKRD